jgi:hypothetical protein
MDSLERIRKAADESVARACGFAVLGIGSVMAALSFDALLAAKSGAILTSLMAAVLHARAEQAPKRPFKTTEVYAILDRKLGVPASHAQLLVGNALQDSYRRHGTLALWGAGALTLVRLLG